MLIPGENAQHVVDLIRRNQTPGFQRDAGKIIQSSSPAMRPNNCISDPLANRPATTAPALVPHTMSTGMFSSCSTCSTPRC